MITVGIREGAGSGTDVTAALRAHGVDGSIVFGGITEIDERPFGSLTVELGGDDRAIEALIAELRSTTDVHDLGTRDAPRDDPSALVDGEPPEGSADGEASIDVDPYGFAIDAVQRHGSTGDGGGPR
jgi:D-methionine transport system ATP-binding protein